jgi:dolichol-phosphate mannosyltransferase
MQNLCVIIPFYNEIRFIEESINRVLKDDIYDQIILSDDCSNDGSEIIARNFSNNYDKIFYIKSNKNLGKGNALSQAKTLIKTSHVVVHDADLEYFPSDIVEMFNCAKKNPEFLILGSRFIGTKERKNVYLRTSIANKLMSTFFSLVNFYKVTDVASCYKLMPVSFFKKIDLVEKGFSIEIELLSKYLKAQRIIIEVPIKYEGRSYSEGKKIKTSDGLLYLFNTLKYKFF